MRKKKYFGFMATDDRKVSENKRVRQGSQEKIGKNGGKRRAIGMPLSCFLDNCMGLSILNNSTGLSEDVNRLRSATALTAHCHRLLRYVPLPPNIFIILITIITNQTDH